MLPIRTSIEDIDAICLYLTSKPTGATPAEAKAVVDKRHLEGRKLTALKTWGLIEESDTKIKITELGRKTVRDSGAFKSDAFKEVIRNIDPYVKVVERIVHRHEKSLSATDLAAHWYEHFRNEVSESDKVLNEQAICFFQIAQSADLGTLLFGRKGQQTRFEFDSGLATSFIRDFVSEGVQVQFEKSEETKFPDDEEEGESSSVDNPSPDISEAAPASDSQADPPTMGVAIESNRLFITHGKNFKILDQVKQIVLFGKFEPVIAIEHETSAKPVPKKVMDDMRECCAAVIHVNTDRVLLDDDGNKVPLINENVLIEIGAAMALYGDKFVLLVEEGVTLPSNLQGLYECRYDGAELSADAMLKLLKALNEF